MNTLQGIFDPGKVAIYLAGNLISGYAEDVIKIEVDSPEYYDDLGLDGEIVRWPSNDYRANITLSLLQTSPSNALCQALLLADRFSGGGQFSLAVKNTNPAVKDGRIQSFDAIASDSYISAIAWILKNPPVIYRKGIAQRDWIVRCANIFMITLGDGTLL